MFSALHLPKLGYVTHTRLVLRYCMLGLSHRNLIIAVLVKKFSSFLGGGEGGVEG